MAGVWRHRPTAPPAGSGEIDRDGARPHAIVGILTGEDRRGRAIRASPRPRSDHDACAEIPRHSIGRQRLAMIRHSGELSPRIALSLSSLMISELMACTDAGERRLFF